MSAISTYETETRAGKESAETVVKEIRRATLKHCSAEEIIRIVLEGLRGEDRVAELCRREDIPSNVYCRWFKGFLEAGKERLADDAAREATWTRRSYSDGERQD
ncbi:transposase [Microvirga aerilata]|uniref:Transposase n=1 Tax=Microvirga aerilata TaxID=670292 RepID=A0A936ZAG6_9HYPH|nr:transposase [Microvirga aerilata]